MLTISFNNWLVINLGLKMVLFSQDNVAKRYLLYSQVYRVTYNPCRVTLLLFASKQRRYLAKYCLCDRVHRSSVISLDIVQRQGTHSDD